MGWLWRATVFYTFLHDLNGVSPRDGYYSGFVPDDGPRRPVRRLNPNPCEVAMKRYLFLSTVLAMLMLAAGCASQETRGSEQGGGPGGPGGPGGQAGPVSAEQRVADMRTKLGLTADQTAEVKPIIEEQFERRKAIMGKSRSDSREAREKMQAKRDDLEWETDKKLASVLTEDQMLAYTKWIEEEAAHKSEDGRPEPPDGAPSGRSGPPRR